MKEIECEVNNFTYFKEWDGRIEFDTFGSLSAFNDMIYFP